MYFTGSIEPVSRRCLSRLQTNARLTSKRLASTTLPPSPAREPPRFRSRNSFGYALAIGTSSSTPSEAISLTRTKINLVSALAQTIRGYEANFTSNNIVADGVISPGEWNGANGGGDAWNVLREPFTTLDSQGHEFQIMWDNDNLYILYQSNYSAFESTFFLGNPTINFSKENINFYIDPNNDGDLNIDPDTGQIGDPADDFLETDGYQLAFNQFLGNFVSTGADRQGIGFFTEAHVDQSAGDQANWRGPPGNKLPGNQGPGINDSGITVGQTNSNTTGSVTELVIPFADLDADAFIPTPLDADYNGDGAQNAADYTLWRDTLDDNVGGAGNGELDGADGNDNGIVDQADYDLWASDYHPTGSLETGLNATAGVSAGDVWGFNAGFIGDSGPNFLPIWSWHDNPNNNNDPFARWPHGTLTFIGAPEGTTIPEPSAAILLALTGLFLPTRRIRQ